MYTYNKANSKSFKYKLEIIFGLLNLIFMLLLQKVAALGGTKLFLFPVRKNSLSSSLRQAVGTDFLNSNLYIHNRYNPLKSSIRKTIFRRHLTLVKPFLSEVRENQYDFEKLMEPTFSRPFFDELEPDIPSVPAVYVKETEVSKAPNVIIQQENSVEILQTKIRRDFFGTDDLVEENTKITLKITVVDSVEKARNVLEILRIDHEKHPNHVWACDTEVADIDLNLVGRM